MTTTHLVERPSRRSVDQLGPAALALAGLAFAAYPALRPYTDETTLDGAAAMASTAWVVSHVLGMAGFALLALGLTRARLVRPAAAAWLGTVLVLPYYGAETYGLQVIATRALADGDTSLLRLAEDFRMGPLAVTTFGLGLLALAVAGVLLLRALWSRGGAVRLGGALAGAGLLLYLPQFFAPGPLRIAHGVLLGTGLVLVATSVLRRGNRAHLPAG